MCSPEIKGYRKTSISLKNTFWSGLIHKLDATIRKKSISPYDYVTNSYHIDI